LAQKVFRDPVYRHVSFDKGRDRVVLDLIDSLEVQRLRRISQLGVSWVTYHGAEHSRFGHSLGACYLMELALEALKNNQQVERLTEQDRLAALVAALLHDVGHAPFSHVLEGVLFPGTNHESWTLRIIQDERTEINKVLRNYDGLLETVVALIEGRPRELSWVSCLIHGQIDVDRMDYLQRDSHYCGVGYGQFDRARILHTMRLRDIPSQAGVIQPVWLEKGMTAVEEYIFSRYYMYWNVYYHRTTLGGEELLRAIVRRARDVGKQDDKTLGDCSEPLRTVLVQTQEDVLRFLALDDTVILAQLVRWRDDSKTDALLRDLCERFLHRKLLKPVPLKGVGITQYERIGEAEEIVRRKGYDPRYWFLMVKAGTSAYDYYHPEDEEAEESAQTSILIELQETPSGPSQVRELSRLSDHLRAITGTQQAREFCYVPEDCRVEVQKLLRP